MNFMSTKRTKRDFVTTVLFLQLAVFVAVFFDIPIVRQILVSMYFTFLPGYLLVKLLKLDEFDWIEIVLLSVGLSIAFLMLAGLFMNELLPLAGVSRPLSLMPLMITLNGLILVGAVSVNSEKRSFRQLKGDSVRSYAVGLLWVCLPILSIAGAMYLNAYGSSLILLCMLVVASLLFATAVISKKLFPPRLYPLAVFMIAIALLYHSSLVSNYLLQFGSDVGGEYFAFKTTEISAYWSSSNPYAEGEWTAYGRIHSMLSVTILPTIYSTLLNMNSVWMFKIIFPLIFSLVPLGIYQVWQKSFGKKYAFISAFFFMALTQFYTEMLGLNKQIIAELFLVLLLLVVFDMKVKPAKKMICFMIFSVGIVVSHYALAEIFLFFISFTLISLLILKHPGRNITVSMVVFFFVAMFIWYLYTSNSAVFQSFVEFGDHVYNQLDEFFNPTSRGQTVLRGLGLEAPQTIWNTISRVFAYATQALIAIGVVGLIKKRKALQSEYFTLTSVSMAFLVALILVPGLANTLNMTRFYHILLLFLAPLCVLGAETMANLINKRRIEMMTTIVLLTVLIPYFLFQTSFVYEVTGNASYSISLSKYRMSPLTLYGQLGDSDTPRVFGAEWLVNNVAVGHSPIYADFCSRGNQLRIYGTVYLGYVELLYNTTKVKSDGIVYLSSLNVHDEIVVSQKSLWNLTELHFLNDLSKIYSNGRSEVYKNGG